MFIVKVISKIENSYPLEYDLASLRSGGRFAESRLAWRSRRMLFSCVQIELSREPLHVLDRVRDARSALQHLFATH